MRDLTPATETEQYLAAQAIHEHRKLEEADALVDTLTPRERFFIEEAWRAGANTARKQLTQALLNPQAETLNARAVHETIGKWRFEPGVFQPPGWDRMGEHYDPRVLDLIRRAQKENLNG